MMTDDWDFSPIETKPKVLPQRSESKVQAPLLLPNPPTVVPMQKSETPPKSQAPSTYVSGLCMNGYCYKTAIKDGERTIPSCQWHYEYRDTRITCTHSCHDEFQQMIDAIVKMAEEAGADPRFMLPPELREAATYVRTISDKRLYDPALTAPTLEARTFGPTPSGRAARGELEENVRKVIVQFKDFPELTPQTIGVLINKDNPPSVGAIHAVLERWNRKGLCSVEYKPYRFGGFTELGERHLVK